MNSALQAFLVAMATFALISIVYFIYRTAKKHRSDIESRSRTIPIRTVPDLPTSASFIGLGESQLFDPYLTRIEMSDLVTGTRNFSPELIVGGGTFGYIYKANLPSCVTVAIKKLGADAFRGHREFRAEMETLGKIRHDNIVRFFGYCATGSDRILIYEFVEKGSLDQWLYDMSPENDTSSLTWGTRVKIIKGKKFSIPVGDAISASNVLLDSNFEARVADFSLARRIEDARSYVTTRVEGTVGYMPPEYFYGAPMATMRGDVYSFGILMFEVVTSKRSNLTIRDGRWKEIRLVEWATAMVSQNREMEMVDVGLPREELKVTEVLEFFRIATFCTTESHKLRPNMNEVVDLLDQIPD
ncbi:hypothetical protein OSB04_005835 [Centaurea solstitialis]|uniref:Protein kinase domain-containing protein n=1 Tax=Centaurea solstitialis TaxID=347529 RepID=A0AA38WPZ1_9ASTR|nr:hypothetical protein OSB04_005835 [Centaurea solstitialis]